MTSLFEEPLAETIIRADNGYIVITNAGRFVIVGAGRDIKNLMNTVKIFVSLQRGSKPIFPFQNNLIIIRRAYSYGCPPLSLGISRSYRI